MPTPRVGTPPRRSPKAPPPPLPVLTLHDLLGERVLVRLAQPGQPQPFQVVPPESFVVDPNSLSMLREVIVSAPLSLLPELIQLAAMRLMGAAGKIGAR